LNGVGLTGNCDQSSGPRSLTVQVGGWTRSVQGQSYIVEFFGLCTENAN